MNDFDSHGKEMSIIIGPNNCNNICERLKDHPLIFM